MAAQLSKTRLSKWRTTSAQRDAGTGFEMTAAERQLHALGGCQLTAKSGAQRQKERRARQHAKALRVAIDVWPEFVERLIECRYLKAWDAMDLNLGREQRRRLAGEVGKAIEAFLRDSDVDVTV
jgi:hypothetical protein